MSPARVNSRSAAVGEDVGAGIAHLVDAVAESHQLLAAPRFCAQDRFGARRVADLEDHLERRPWRAAVERPFQAPSAPTTADTRSEPVEVMTRAVNVDALRP